MVDKLVVQIQDTIIELVDCTDEDVQADVHKAQNYIQDADNSKLVRQPRVACNLIPPFEPQGHV